MCELTPLSTTETVLSTNLEWGNKIYIKVKKPWALCRRHDHRAALDNMGTYASFQLCASTKNTTHATYGQYKMLCGAIQPPTGSGSKLTADWVT